MLSEIIEYKKEYEVFEQHDNTFYFNVISKEELVEEGNAWVSIQKKTE